MASDSGPSADLLEILRCSFCRSPLERSAGGLACPGCGRTYETDGPIPLMLHRDLPGAEEKLGELASWVEEAKAEGLYEPSDEIDSVLPFPMRDLPGFVDLTWLANGHSFQVPLDRNVGAERGLRVVEVGAAKSWAAPYRRERGCEYALDLPLTLSVRVTKPRGGVAGLNEGTRGFRSSSDNPAQEGEKSLGINEHVHTVWAYLAAFRKAGLTVRRIERSEGWPPKPWGGLLSRIPKIGMTLGTFVHLSAAGHGSVSIYARKRG